MIQKLNVRAPLNPLSLGQVSFNILRELFRRKIQVNLHPFGQPDLSAYPVEPAFGKWLEHSVNTRYENISRNAPTLSIWHINGSELKLSDRSYLLTFHETDSPTTQEINIVNQHDFTFFTSNWSVDNFKQYGAPNVGFVPLGLDENFAPIEGRIIDPSITHWILVGKAEARKNTAGIVRTWIKRYGGNKKHQLTLCVHNHFFRKETCGYDMNDWYASLFGSANWQNDKPFNVNILPPLKTNAEMNRLYNSADIDLSGLSSAEGWGIPAHTATALGKWSIVSNCSAHKDWANDKNSVLVEPTQMRPVYDGVFFAKGSPFSQGNVYDFSTKQLEEAMERAEKLAGTPNVEGAKLRTEHTYAKTVDTILTEMS